jgi:hypothetical protein
MNTWDENHRRTTLSVCSVVDHLADSVDLLAAWPAAAPNQCQRRIIASTDLTTGIFSRTQSRVQARCSTKTRRWLLSASYRSSAVSGMQLDPEPDKLLGWHSVGWSWSCPSRPEMAGTRDARPSGRRSGDTNTALQLKIDHWKSHARSGTRKPTGGRASTLFLPFASSVPLRMRL